MVVGLGSGQASGMAIQYLGRQLRAGALKDIVGIPMWVWVLFQLSLTTLWNAAVCCVCGHFLQMKQLIKPYYL